MESHFHCCIFIFCLYIFGLQFHIRRYQLLKIKLQHSTLSFLSPSCCSFPGELSHVLSSLFLQSKLSKQAGIWAEEFSCSLHRRNPRVNLPHDPPMHLGRAQLDSQLCDFYSRFAQVLANLGARGQHWQKERNCSGEPAGLQTPARQKSLSRMAGITPLFQLGISVSFVCISSSHPASPAAVRGSSQHTKQMALWLGCLSSTRHWPLASGWNPSPSAGL